MLLLDKKVLIQKMTDKPTSQKTSPPKRVRQKPAPKPKQLPNVGPAAETNKYAPKEKIGTPTLGREKGYVTRVGLGNLETITYGNTDVQP